MAQINENSSMLIIARESKGPFIFSRYDEGYSRPLYRGRVNLMGGAEEKNDIGPNETIAREVTEEISAPSETEGFAPLEVITGFRNQVLTNLHHFKDFLSVVPVPPKQGQERGFNYVSIDSAFYTEINPALFDEIKNQLANGRKIVSEGLLSIVTADDLVKGTALCAWSTGQIMSHYLEADIPMPENALSIPLKTPLQKSHSDYRKMFEYEKK